MRYFFWSSLPELVIPGVLLLNIFALLILLLVRERKTEYVLYALIVWFPLESFFLKFVGPVWYDTLKYIPEIILYSVLIGLVIKHWYLGRTLFVPHSLRTPFLFFIFVALFSLIYNWYDPGIWLLGLRQLIRFVSVFFIVLLAAYAESTRKTILTLIIGVACVQAAVGLVQIGFGGSLDAFLFPNPAAASGTFASQTSGEMFWTPGTRAFATMGRYDQLGSFLMIGLIIFLTQTAINGKKITPRNALILCVLALGLFFTKSRASWLGALIALAFSSYFLLKNKKIMQALIAGTLGIVVYVIGFIITHNNITQITEKANQSVAERIVESASLRAWRESYDGYGRIFFIINTPRVVVADSPLVGVGPGNYGGGAAAALENTKEYDRLHLPFGIENTYGQIDNSWFSIWGELGTCGVAVVIWILYVLAKDARYVYRESTHEHTKYMSALVFTLVIAISVIGFFGPYFEFRTLMFNFWLIVGLLYAASRHDTRSGNFLFRKI